jgi:hypothetical protein
LIIWKVVIFLPPPLSITLSCKKKKERK